MSSTSSSGGPSSGQADSAAERVSAAVESSEAVVRPPGFDLGEARMCAGLTRDAYAMYAQWVAQGRPRKDAGFEWKAPERPGLSFSVPIWSHQKWLAVLNESEPFGFVARSEQGSVYLVYRGTESLHDWLENVEIGQRVYPYAGEGEKVHRGFLDVYEGLREEQDAALEGMGSVERLCLASHSLGGALTTLALPDLCARLAGVPVTHYTFASPRVGDPGFARTYAAAASTTFRVVNSSDIVPTVPPAVLPEALYRHVGSIVGFTAQYGTLVSNHSLADCYSYAIEYPDAPQRPA